MSDARPDSEHFEPENDLERALLALHRGEGSRAGVLAALESAEVVVPRPAGGGPGEPEELQLPVMRSGDGRRAVPLFTSPGRLAAAVEVETAYLQVAFGALAEGWPPDVGALIDPGGPLELMLAIGAEGPARPGPNAVAAGSRVLVGDPAQEPEGALEALGALFASIPAVEAAWRAQVYIEAPGEVPHVAIGVRAAEGTDLDGLFERASEGLSAETQTPFSFLAVGAEPDGDDPITSHMLAETEPFYRRRAAGS